jgi:thiamine-phosphate pyrophosphorylase
VTAPSRDHSSSLKGLYLILDESAAAPGRPLLEALREAAAAGAWLFQYRNKIASGAEAYRQAVRLREAAGEAGALFLVNDRCDLALAVEADGVHLGQDDLPLAMARSLVGPGKLIGISTHRAEQVIEADRGGADYIGFGPLFPTDSKPDHDPVVGLDGLRKIRPLTRLPIFAIGGISVDRVEAVISAGADGVAVIAAVLASPDIRAAVRAFRSRFT